MDGEHEAMEIDYRLVRVQQEWLDGQQKYMLQWLYAHDMVLGVNGVITMALAGAIFFLAWKVEKLERTAHATTD